MSGAATQDITIRCSIRLLFYSTVPDPPVLKSATSYDSQTLVISWAGLDCKSINSESVDKYIVRYGNAAIGEQKAMVNASTNSTSISNSLLRPFTEYEMAVAAKSSVGMSNYSSTMMAVILTGKITTTTTTNNF